LGINRKLQVQEIKRAVEARLSAFIIFVTFFAHLLRAPAVARWCLRSSMADDARTGNSLLLKAELLTEKDTKIVSAAPSPPAASHAPSSIASGDSKAESKPRAAAPKLHAPPAETALNQALPLAEKHSPTNKPKELAEPSSHGRAEHESAESWATFTRQLCQALEMRNVATCTAQSTYSFPRPILNTPFFASNNSLTSPLLVFFHRFFARFSFKNQDRYVVSMACVFLAGKVEENVQNLDHVIQAAQKLRQLPVLDEERLWKLREKVLVCERNLLQALDFEISVRNFA